MSRQKKDVSPKVEFFHLSDLLLDMSNPRFGSHAEQSKEQAKLLDMIVDEYGVDDVLSSIAVNGYFTAEPLVGMRAENGKIRIKEGNRRLAACLILGDDPRAKGHVRRAKNFQEIQKDAKQEPIVTLPVIVLESESAITAYLGVRHIVSAKQWDASAKAQWVANVVESGVSLSELKRMLGDEFNTVPRILEGHYFVKQLVDENRFIPSESRRRGRGSNPEFPFSWLYTALGYGAIRQWLGLEDRNAENMQSKPIPPQKMDDAAKLPVFLFGNSGKNKAAAIEDSRQIAELARVIAAPDGLRHLERGKNVTEVLELLQPPTVRVINHLDDARDILTQALAPLMAGEINREQARELEIPSDAVIKLATNIRNEIKKIIFDSSEGKE